MADEKALMCYQNTMRIAKQWLVSGLITEGDYEKFDTIVAEKFSVSARSIWRDINLQTVRKLQEIPYLLQHSMPHKMTRMFSACWFRYCEDRFWFSDFLHDCCVIDPYATEKPGELLEAYRKYSLGRNRPPRASSAFCGELMDHGFKRRKTKHGMLVSGLRLRNA